MYIIPKNIDGVDSKLLNPIETWTDGENYQKYLKELVEKFQNNFKKFDDPRNFGGSAPTNVL